MDTYTFQLFTTNNVFSNLVVILPMLCSAPSARRSATYKASATIGMIGAFLTYTKPFSEKWDQNCPKS